MLISFFVLFKEVKARQEDLVLFLPTSCPSSLVFQGSGRHCEGSASLKSHLCSGKQFDAILPVQG